MTAENFGALPSVIVVGPQGLADLLSNSGAAWIVHPAAPTTEDMWNFIDNGTLPGEADVYVFADGTGVGSGDLELTLAACAPYAEVFLVADPSLGPSIIEEARRRAPEVAGGDSTKPIHFMPSNDLREAMAVLQQQTAHMIQWEPQAPPAPAQDEYAPPAPPDVPVPPTQHEYSAPPAAPTPDQYAPPAPQQYAPPTPDQYAPPAPQQYAPPTPPASQPAPDYDQTSFYAPHVAEQATQTYNKPENAIPGNITIAVMSSKGGSGKSTTALSLAGTIAKSTAAAGQPKRVVVVDLDTRDGQIGSLIGQYMPTAVNIRVLPRWDAAAVKANLVHDKRLGVDALLAPVRPRNADDVGPEFYKQIIQVLQSTHDVIILDCSVNYLDPLLGVAFGLSDEILFVTTLATTSVQGMARALNEMFADPSEGGLGIPREKVGVVANQVINNVGMGKDKMLKAALGAPLVGQIPAEQDTVLIATNSNRMADLLKHPRLGPAYFKLASTCLPKWALLPLTVEGGTPPQQGGVPGTPVADDGKKKGGFFRR